ncbi:uncharacterized protein LOC103569378 [Microplitis demolitor]|uniref:uncharacterized protein LOC103569378 n=1 Tax=Microplitis demolitor TaxID=69319 RepID=UPI0004CCB428|nr:uncharacterized protein LOC103569378 [Microplitis demolitor]
MTTQNTDIATTESYRQSRVYRRGYDHDHDDDDHDNQEDMDHMDVNDDMDSKSLAESKGEYWGGYYDFLINEGSYKFWAVFQLATAALLIYSGFAALYYAKVNPSTTDDYEDYFLRRRKRHISDTLFYIDGPTFQRIIDALENIH